MEHTVAGLVLPGVGCELLGPCWHSLGIVRCKSGSGTAPARYSLHPGSILPHCRPRLQTTPPYSVLKACARMGGQSPGIG